jgi:hypothetical protein
MSTITLRLDPIIDTQIRSQAKTKGTSPSQVINQLLKQALKTVTTKRQLKYRDLAEFCGTWTEEEYQEFKQATKDFERIDPEDWK